MKTAKKEPTERRMYMLPSRIHKLIRKEAAQRGVWPARIVAERLDESFRRRPVPRDV